MPTTSHALPEELSRHAIGICVSLLGMSCNGCGLLLVLLLYSFLRLLQLYFSARSKMGWLPCSVWVCRVDDENAPDKMTELHRIDLLPANQKLSPPRLGLKVSVPLEEPLHAMQGLLDVL